MMQKEMTEIETEEKENQKEYEAFMSLSSEKRTSDAKSIEDKDMHEPFCAVPRN